MKAVQLTLFPATVEAVKSASASKDIERIWEHKILCDVEFDKLCSAQDLLALYVEYRNEGFFYGTVEEFFENTGNYNLLPYIK